MQETQIQIKLCPEREKSTDQCMIDARKYRKMPHHHVMLRKMEQ